MRNLSAGNRKDFTIFAMVIILIIGVFIVGLNVVLAKDGKEYTLDESTIVFDKDYNIIELEQKSKIYQKWDGNLYLKTRNEEFILGKNAICYSKSKNKLNIYGDSFEVVKGGDITKYLEQNEIIDLSQNRFLKLEDRKYLVIGNDIKNTTGSIDTKNFLIVHLDKTGDTLLSNYELNMKTIKPLKIKTASYEFDIANEKLIYGEEEIDLKKIIGSTNEYREVKQEIKTASEQEEDKEEEENTHINQIEGKDLVQSAQSQNSPSNFENQPNYLPQSQSQTQNGGQAASNIQTQTQTTTTNNSQQSIQIQNQTQTTTNINKEENKKENQNKTPLAKSINLRAITARSSSLDVQYAILDAENKYQTVYLDLQGDIQKTIALDKTQKNYLITGLTPNTEYKVTLAYKEILENNEIVDGIEDTIIVRTSKISDSITIDKIAQNKLYFTYKMDPNYVYEAAKIALYVGNEKINEVDVDISSAITANGWISSMEFDYGSEIVLKLENAIYEGQEVRRDLQAKVKLY